MNIVVCLAAAICVLAANGCSPGEESTTAAGWTVEGVPSGSVHAVEAAPKEQVQWLNVKRFSVTKNSLRLDYRVTNIFPHDLWVCTSMECCASGDGEETVETRIVEETLRIRRRGNVEQSLFVQTGCGCAVYRRLAPKRSRSGTVGSRSPS